MFLGSLYPPIPLMGSLDPRIMAQCLSFPPGAMLFIPEQGRAVSSRVLFGVGSWGLIHDSSWHLGAVGSSQDLALPIFMCSGGGVCTCWSPKGELGCGNSYLSRHRSQGTPQPRGRGLPGCQHHGKALLLPDRMPGTGKASPITGKAQEVELPLPTLPIPPSGLRSGSSSWMQPSAFHEPDPPGSCCHPALRCHFCLIKCKSLSSRLRLAKISVFPSKETLPNLRVFPKGCK